MGNVGSNRKPTKKSQPLHAMPSGETSSNVRSIDSLSVLRIKLVAIDLDVFSTMRLHDDVLVKWDDDYYACYSGGYVLGHVPRNYNSHFSKSRIYHAVIVALSNNPLTVVIEVSK